MHAHTRIHTDVHTHTRSCIWKCTNRPCDEGRGVRGEALTLQDGLDPEFFQAPELHDG